MTQTKLDAFTRAYIECALWSSTTGEDDTPMDREHSAEDIAPEALDQIVADCEKFQSDNAKWITRDFSYKVNFTEQAGHDFWLTRNGHGSGFWDGDWTDEAGTALTDAAKGFETVDLYVGDDGKVYV